MRVYDAQHSIQDYFDKDRILAVVYQWPSKQAAFSMEPSHTVGHLRKLLSSQTDWKFQNVYSRDGDNLSDDALMSQVRTKWPVCIFSAR